MNSKAAVAWVWVRDRGRVMKERVKKEMELLLWDICLINEDVEAVSRGIVVIKIVMEK